MMKRIHSVLSWPTRRLNDLAYDHLGGARFNRWANEKERRWRARRNGPLVLALHESGLHDSAERLRASGEVPA